jgi:5,10-methylenetetrahydrofolate reductase
VPELCVEIVSPSDHEKETLEEKLERFHAMGVSEVVAFDPDAPPGRRVRAWDLVSGDLVERVVEGDETPCTTLGLWFVVAPAVLNDLTDALRLAEDATGRKIVPTLAERERAEKERERAEKEAERTARHRERAEKEAALAGEHRERAEKEAALAELARLRAKLAAGPGVRKKARRR